MRTSAKLAQWVAPKFYPFTGTLKNQAKTIRINCVRTVENSNQINTESRKNVTQKQ